MKQLYSIKSGAYKTSKDYAHLKELLDAGHYVICFIHYAPQGTQYEFQDICIANNFVDCGDIDARCFFMTYLTLSLLGVPAVVRLGDALKLEYRAAWFTPAYIFGYSHFYSRLKNGDYPRAATIPKTQSETKQVTEPPTTKADKYGQLSLLF